MKITLSILLIGLLPAVVSADTAQLNTKEAAPKITRHVEPVYPLEARAAGLEGTVLVECLVAPDGTVIAAGAVAKSIDQKFDEAAIEAVSKWKFTARSESQNPRLVRIPIHFNLIEPVGEIETAHIAAR